MSGEKLTEFERGVLHGARLAANTLIDVAQEDRSLLLKSRELLIQVGMILLQGVTDAEVELAS